MYTIQTVNKELKLFVIATTKAKLPGFNANDWIWKLFKIESQTK